MSDTASEGSIRDAWYSDIVNYLLDQNIDNVTIPELVLQNKQRPDLVTYICENEYCNPFLLIEFKKKPSGRPSKAYFQSLNYSNIIKPRYTVIAYFANIYCSLNITDEQTKQKQFKMFFSCDEMIDAFWDFFENKIFTYRHSGGIHKKSLIKEIFRAPTYERFLRAEFFRILANNNLIPRSEYSVTHENNMVRPDLVIFTKNSNKPLLVLEFKSEYTPSMFSQAYKYKKALNPYYYGEVYGTKNSVRVNIFDMQGQCIINDYIKFGNPYLNEDEVISIIKKLQQNSKSEDH